MGIDPGGGWRSVALPVRNLPLAGVAVSLGYRRDGLDRSRWKRAGSVLSINGAKFFDHLAGSGGGGAIDLVMHARYCGFRDAVWYLAGRGFAAPVVKDGSGGRAEGDCREAFRLPERADFFWPRVRDWLASERGLDGCLLDRCWRRGLAYADARMHAVFVCRCQTTTIMATSDNYHAAHLRGDLAGVFPVPGSWRVGVLSPGDPIIRA